MGRAAVSGTTHAGCTRILSLSRTDLVPLGGTAEGVKGTDHPATGLILAARDSTRNAAILFADAT
jgi:hypothetical protein